MATSGSKTFSLSISDTIEEAFELAGIELRTGYDAETARRSLNIMFADWSNRGVNLWTIEQVTTTLTSGTSSYTLNSYDIDIVSAVIQQTDGNSNTTDLNIERIGRTEYLQIPDKTITGRPTQLFLDRQTTPVVKLWPVPDDTYTYKLIANTIQRIDDVTASTVSGVEQDFDVPSRFYEAMISGLAYYMSLKRAGMDPNRSVYLKQEYELAFRRARDADLNQSINIVPNYGYTFE